MPMTTPTPRTDAAIEAALAEPGMGASFEAASNIARQLERENATLRSAQKACVDCDGFTAAEAGKNKNDLALIRAELAGVDTICSSQDPVEAVMQLVAELRKRCEDKHRLDWIGARCFDVAQTEDGWYVAGLNLPETGMSEIRPTIREAIDEAQRALRGGLK